MALLGQALKWQQHQARSGEGVATPLDPGTESLSAPVSVPCTAAAAPESPLRAPPLAHCSTPVRPGAAPARDGVRSLPGGGAHEAGRGGDLPDRYPPARAAPLRLRTPTSPHPPRGSSPLSAAPLASSPPRPSPLSGDEDDQVRKEVPRGVRAVQPRRADALQRVRGRLPRGALRTPFLPRTRGHALHAPDQSCLRAVVAGSRTLFVP